MTKDYNGWIIGGLAVLAGFLILSQRGKAQTNASLIDYRWCTCESVRPGQNCIIYATVNNPSSMMQATFTISVNNAVISSQPVSVPAGLNEIQIGSYVIPSFTGSQSFNLVVTIL